MIASLSLIAACSFMIGLLGPIRYRGTLAECLMAAVAGAMLSAALVSATLRALSPAPLLVLLTGLCLMLSCGLAGILAKVAIGWLAVRRIKRRIDKEIERLEKSLEELNKTERDED